MLGLSGETLQGMSLDSRSLCGYGKSLCGNGKPSGKFEPQKFNPKPRIKKNRDHRLCDEKIVFKINNFLAQQEATQYFIVTQLFVTANGPSELSRTDNNHRLLKQDTKNQKKRCS
jgi:hypothetical protein